jgi:hypothetical protein
MMASRQRWTHEDDRRLVEMRAAGKPPAVIAKELGRTEPAVINRTRALKRRRTRAKGEGQMPGDALPRSFNCPKLDCGIEYFAIERDVPPAAKPKCLECGTPFLARTREGYVHYYSARHVFD